MRLGVELNIWCGTRRRDAIRRKQQPDEQRRSIFIAAEHSGRLIRRCVPTVIDPLNETPVLCLPPPELGCEGGRANRAPEKLPSLPKEIGLLIPIILIIEHSDEK